MDDQDIIAKYKEIAAFLHMCLGRNVEIVVHDLRSPDHSVVAIYNNEISRRNVGAPLTDFALNIMRDKVYEKKPYLANYAGLSHDGLRLRSSTFFIKNRKNKLIGLLCLNIDVTRQQRLMSELQSLFKCEMPATVAEKEAREGDVGGDAGYQEIFPASVTEMIDIIIDKKKGGVAASRLTPGEKIDIVDELNNQGIFMFKGSIPATADRLHISEATVYRYLSKLKRRRNGDSVA